jgi:hypothetical protein
LFQKAIEHLGRDVRAYMHVLNVGKTIGIQPDRHYRALGGREFVDASFSIWCLLERHLANIPPSDFPSNGWVDGFRFEAVEMRGRDDVYFYGLFIWVQGQEHWWLDPGSIEIEFVPNSDAVARYVLRFGDANMGLARRPYTHGAVTGLKPSAWLFEFHGPGHIVSAG